MSSVTITAPSSSASSTSGMTEEQDPVTMTEAMAGLMESYADYSNTNSLSQMGTANAAALQQVQNLDNVNEQMDQISEQDEKEQKWGWVGKMFTTVISICLIPIDPFLSMTMMSGQILGSTGVVKDLVNWISEGLQDIFPDMSDEWAKALSDIILVATVVIAAVVIGVLTAGTGDVVMAEAAAEMIGEDVAEDVGTELLDVVGEDVSKAGKDAVGVAADDTVATAASDMGKAADTTATDAKDKKPIKNVAARRGAKFGTMMGSQMIMQTNAGTNIVSAMASSSSDPDSKGWKIAELSVFIAQSLLCLGATIGACFVEAPSVIDNSFKGSSSYTKIRKFGQKAAIAAGIAQGISNTVAGGYGVAAAYNTNKMKDEASDMVLSTALIDMSNTVGDEVQKEISDLERSIYEGQNLADIYRGYQIA